MEKGKFSSSIAISPAAQKVLTEIEQRREQGENNWNIPREVGELLYTKILESSAKSVIEIGTSIGYSGIIIAQALAQTRGHLYTIESHQGRFDQAAQNFSAAEVSSYITQILGHAPQAFIPNDQKPKSMYRKSGLLHKFNQFNRVFKDLSFDLAFFDATKKEHITFFQSIQPYMSPGHTIITDNMLSHKEEMQPYLDYVFSLPNYTSELLELGTGVLISTHNSLSSAHPAC